MVIREGPCEKGMCGEEEACKDFQNNTHTCICTHDSLPPTAEGTCPRRTGEMFKFIVFLHLPLEDEIIFVILFDVTMCGLCPMDNISV